MLEIRSRLTPLQYQVTQEDGTEPPFQNAYWNQKADGIYVDVVSESRTFSSLHKYDWYRLAILLEAAESSHIVERDDNKLWMKRVEVRSKFGDSHLGHVFPDGPKPTGLRYCINSAALRFVAVDTGKSRLRKIFGRFFNGS